MKQEAVKRIGTYGCKSKGWLNVECPRSCHSVQHQFVVKSLNTDTSLPSLVRLLPKRGDYTCITRGFIRLLCDTTKLCKVQNKSLGM